MKNRILVVDDEIDSLESVRRGLITSGFKGIQIESDPQQAAAVENGTVFEVALIDITMPGMDGVQLLEVIEKSQPQIECIMITALDEYPELVLYSHPGAAMPWMESAVHSQGTLQAQRRQLIQEELVRVHTYQNKGDLARFEDVLDYLNRRDT